MFLREEGEHSRHDMAVSPFLVHRKAVCDMKLHGREEGDFYTSIPPKRPHALSAKVRFDAHPNHDKPTYSFWRERASL